MPELSCSLFVHVACSFMSKTEAVATQINDRLQDDIGRCLSTNQKKLVGTMEKSLLARCAQRIKRIVACLYRPNGYTPWTRMEQTPFDKSSTHDHVTHRRLCTLRWRNTSRNSRGRPLQMAARPRRDGGTARAVTDIRSRGGLRRELGERRQSTFRHSCQPQKA